MATRTRPHLGHVKGQPIRFINGHQGRRGPDFAYAHTGYDTPCLVWQHSTTRDGYGRWRAGRGRRVLTHVLAWQRVHGPVPPGLELDHLCRVRACAEVAHLELVTRAQNVQRGSRTRLTADQARAIAAATAQTAAALAAAYGVCATTIRRIRTGRSWSTVTGIPNPAAT